ncbi:efflux RND transporter permease subunit [Colwellia sp. 4_MG-2023]|uniref:efflux RND transporter permease subunit n=1 Tax=unclassified Colwellia TaxID=196834 RepID=UPI0026E269A1|nr:MULTISPECIES: efflux RND transporter permease subunit [unclassified Colwellia]MDO6508270.1 efflux RND transporter permease subunit [Colwellia sp. 5_MG-2023]MDO6556887.1 efflux RND transporter permease subunit [Colwellia sp. 4_MG-2023]
MQTPSNLTSTLLKRTLNSKIPFILLMLSIIAGIMALNYTPREEEPQIVVPMIDIIVSAPGVNVQQVERLVTTPLEKLLSQVTGVEHVYSVTNNSQTIVTLRFHVGENREKALLNTYNKLHSNTDNIPSIVSNWRVKPIEVDDVPIVMLGLWSSDSETVDDYSLRRLAEEVSTFLQAIESTSEVNIVGGRSREIQVNLNPEQMTARKIAMNEVLNAIHSSNALQHHGNITLENQSFRLESGDVFRDIETLKQTPINVIDGSVVLLKDIATIIDGPSEQNNYTWIDFANEYQQEHYSPKNRSSEAIKFPNNGDHPLVTISVAKQRGSNAVKVAQAVHDKINELQKTIFPANVHVQTLRDYGETANEKVNNLTTSLAFAVFTVVVFIAVFLGWRSALVVGLAVPICYGITLSLDLLFGYTINRVTLFALILSLGLLVDDPITGVDNIERYLKEKSGSLQDKIVGAINEIRVPLLMSTLTIVLAFVPLAFITGMMGPYMAPMAFNVPLSVISSTLVAFLVTPWLASKFIKPKTTTDLAIADKGNQGFEQFYRRILTPLLDNRKKGKFVLWLVLGLFIIAAMLPVLRLVPLKLLPFDNKNEVQIIIDMPESATLEQTATIAKTVSNKVQQLSEVKAIAAYVGTSSPIDFNGMVRQYYQRQTPYMADLRIILLDKTEREHQSHAIVLRLREHLKSINTSLFKDNDIQIKVVEVPPGPPVLSTLVAELYGDELTQYSELQQAASIVKKRLKQEPHVVEVDSTVGDDQPRLRFITDKTKAALSGISTQNINQAIAVANNGTVAGYLHVNEEATPLAINIKLPIEQRETLADIYRLTIKGQAGIVQQTTPQGIDIAPQSLVSLGELGQFEQGISDKVILHKDLRPVVYVTADISGRTPAAVIADISSDLHYRNIEDNIEENSPALAQSNDWQNRTFLTSGSGNAWYLPDNIHLSWSGEGEWRITIRVFRDMGIAFAFALTAIFIVLRIQTGSAALSGIIMSAIPLTVIGIMPGFFMLNQFGERTIANAPDSVLFTATAMIGMIALAGIVVRNSLILIEFITQARDRGESIKEALIQAGSVRMRPVLLTAGTTLLGNLIITLDPVFSGLAIAIIFGIISSTIFTLLVVPIVYLLVFDNENQQQSSNHSSLEQPNKAVI